MAPKILVTWLLLSSYNKNVSFMRSSFCQTPLHVLIAGNFFNNSKPYGFCLFLQTSTARSMSTPGNIVGVQETTDYTSWTNADLIARVSDLERQLRQQSSQSLARSTSAKNKQIRSHGAKVLDSRKYSTRHIALKIAYLGQRYNGYEHANGNSTPLPTVEEMLWKALRKACLIDPVTDQPIEVAWSYAERSRKPLNINWDGCQYSKCGRTDKGVSAFGQVIGIRVRSNRPVKKSNETATNVDVDGEFAGSDLTAPSEPPAFDEETISHDANSSFNPVKDELPYLSILNSVLPSDIRVLAWCPNPPVDFDARFSCGERQYKYFFTNPAFLPTPGPIGLKDGSGNETGLREGWLDVDAMGNAAKKLIGLHDFRNFCRVDASKQSATFERRITHVAVEEVRQQNGPVAFFEQGHLAKTAGETQFTHIDTMQVSGPKVYSFTVHGSAFLWHQVRHMAAILFLIGQKLESSSIIDELLDVEKNRCRPQYEMASDAPLVLWDCIFPKDRAEGQQDGLDWIYAGDARSLEGSTNKGDGKFGRGGVVDEVWSKWRSHKIDETLASTLLDLVVRQGDDSAFQRGGYRDLGTQGCRSQKLFNGSETPRMAGKYISVMEKPKMETVDEQNTRYRTGKACRREVRRYRNSMEMAEEKGPLDYPRPS